MLSTKKHLSVILAVSLLVEVCMGAATAPPPDPGWPRQVANDQGTLIYYQPQIDSWNNYKDLVGRAAFSITPKSGKGTVGVVSFHSTTDVDKDTRTVYLHDIDYTSVRFPYLDAQSAQPMEQLFRSLAPQHAEPIALDRLMADLECSNAAAPSVAVNNDPPQIFYSASPAILLTVQGQPVLSNIEKTDLQFVVNTNWDLFFEKSKKQYFLLVTATWLTAPDLKGPWTLTSTLPKDMAKLPEGQNWDAVKKLVPPLAQSGAAPEVFFSTTPAELILFKGAPVYSRVPVL